MVDDESLVADVLAFALEDEGHRVRRATSGTMALEHLAQEPVALVITDYMMPTMNGVEFATALHRDAGVAIPPIILMSGAQAHIARRHGDLFAAVFVKPFRIADLVARVRMVLDPAD